MRSSVYVDRTAGRAAVPAWSVALLVSLLCAVVGGLVCASDPASAATKWAKVSSFETEAHPYGVALDQASGDVFVADIGSVQRFSPVSRPSPSAGYSLDSPLAGSFSFAIGVAVDDSGGLSQGDVYVTDVGAGVVDKFDAGGLPDAVTPQFGAGASPLALSEPFGVAVDPADGDVYVSDIRNGVVDVYSPLGAFLTQFPAVAEPTMIAFNSTGSGLYVVSSATGKVEEFDAAGNPVEQTAGPNAGTNIVDDSGGAHAVAVDPGTNDVYVADEESVAVYESSGAPLTPGFQPGVDITFGIAVDATTHAVYVADPNSNVVDVFQFVTLADVTSGAATNVTGTSATLNGTIDPDGLPVTSCQFEYGAGTIVPCAQTPAEIGAGTSPVPVSAAVAGLSPNTTYVFHLDVTNENGVSQPQGQNESFRTYGPPTIGGESVANILSTSAEVEARIDPERSDTTYRFEYGTSASYGANVPVPDADIGAGESGQSVSQTLTGLQPSTTYHYRVVASNAYGVEPGADRTFTTYPPPSGPFTLPDGRAYEQVSPVEKNNTDVQVSPGTVQAAPDGDAVTFYSVLPFPGVANGRGPVLYRATRGADGWSTQGLLPETAPALPGLPLFTVYGLTADLSKTVLTTATGPTSALAFNAYVRDNATESDQLLTSLGTFSIGLNIPTFAFSEATPDDSRILFEWSAQLLPGAAPGVPNLYEWDNGQLSLVGVLPDGSAPSAGAVAGPGGPAVGASQGVGGQPGGATSSFYTQNTISEDGSRVFFTDVGTGQIYMRENGTTTVPISASQRATPDPNGTQPAFWRAATPDGSQVLFTSAEKLTDDATATPGSPDLYRFDVDSGQLTDLTTADPAGGGVLGTLGVSRDGSYVYFAATGVLANGATAGQPNVYLSHEGTTTFIASLNETCGDVANWSPFGNSGGVCEESYQYRRDSRVTPDGKTLLITSSVPLAGSDTTGNYELYRYEAPSRRLLCVSCAPSGAPMTSGADFGEQTTFFLSYNGDEHLFLTHSLSDDGKRVFFDTKQALVPEDTDGATDVYEWEASGEGSCRSENEDGGCIYLISTGRSPDGSVFGDASPSGNDVFFRARQSLVAQDQDYNADLYDARVGGGIASQNQLPATPCAGEECRGEASSPPLFGAPSSATLSGAGNLTSPAPISAAKPKAKPLTRAQKLARELKGCERRPKNRRTSCDVQARKKYGKPVVKSTRVHKSNRRHHS
jgi:DNA-binding beta-propeller fold protein YncE